MSVNETPRQKTTQSEEHIFVSPKELNDQYMQNNLRAKKKYDGKIMTIESEIVAFAQVGEQICITLRGDSSSNSYFNIECYFDSKYEDKIITLNVGTFFAATGTWKHNSNFGHRQRVLDDCIWAPEYFSGRTESAQYYD